MTSEWSLYVGEVFEDKTAEIAIKAIANGNVGIGTASPTEKLSVNGNIRAKEIKVETANWPDYVFKEDYILKPLTDLAKYINENGHLPEVPKASEVEANGVSVGEMNKILLKKVEELTLHLIENYEKRKEQQEMIEKMLERIKILEIQFQKK